jgi:hypothetical protein
MSNELLSLFLRFSRFLCQATHFVAESGETVMKALVRLAITIAALGATVPAMLATVGCDDPAANALSSVLKPPASKYTVGGTVNGLSGSGLVLEDNGSDDLPVSADGSFTFASSLAVGSPYAVIVKTQPTNPAQSCGLTNASGSIGSANVNNVTVSCTNNATAAVTPVGSALGNPTAKVIDAAGGSITSDDGRLTVMVPAGAVAAATNFTIQPITNQAPGGVGNAYRLGPAGQTFTSPVDITVHYSSADLAGSVTDALSLGYQDAQGRWGVYKSVTLQTTNQAITVSSEHFSDWALIAGASLQPAAARIGTGQTQILDFLICKLVDFGDPLIQYAAVCTSGGAAVGGDWAVNSVPGGNSTVGTVLASVTGDSDVATYTAPGQIPATNPVAVSVDSLVTALGSAIHGKGSGKELFVSNITIGGCSLSNAKDCTYSGTTTTSDSHWKASAQVTWKFVQYAPYDSSIAVYEPSSGTVTLTDLQTNCSVSSASQPVSAAMPTQLGIDYHTSPPTVSGNGTNLSGWTESCAPPENPPLKPGAVWWTDGGTPLSADGSKIEGTWTDGPLTSTFTFTAN